MRKKSLPLKKHEFVIKLSVFVFVALHIVQNNVNYVGCDFQSYFDDDSQNRGAAFSSSSTSSLSSGLQTLDSAAFKQGIVRDCLQQCPDQNRSLSDHLELSHRKDCYLADIPSSNVATCLCSIGCQLWHEALSSSCLNVCNKTETEILDRKELYCVIGCNDALARYLKWLKREIGNPPAPALVADTLTATSLSLEWEIPRRLAEITKGFLEPPQNYLVQFRDDDMPGDWKFCETHIMENNTTIRVENLQPYTKYRFRIALPLSTKQQEFLFSDQSIVINTLPQGPPQEPPIVRAIAVDHSRISVSWEPGANPNGPILSYKLQITDVAPDGYTTLKEIPASDSSFIIVGNLKPSHEYQVTMSTRNANGESPISKVFVNLPDEPPFQDQDQQPKLIVSTQHMIFLQGYDFLSDNPKPFYYSENPIVATAIHIERQLIFVTEDSGHVFRAPLYMEEKPSIISSPEPNVTPKLLSVDWLNDHLYILAEVQHSSGVVVWQISRCDLDGQKMTIAVAGIHDEPSHIEVDPYNGYLFWVIPKHLSNSGLYRLDLAEISNGVRHEGGPGRVISWQDLGAFTIEHSKFRLLVPYQDRNTVFSVSLDGKDTENIRNNTRSAKFESVKSISYANSLFIWTNGREIIREEYHREENVYYHNAVTTDLSNDTIVSVHIDWPFAQPTPVPVNPPVHVQAIFGPKRAKISWQPPHLLGNQGKGAWKNWDYEVEILDEKTGNWSRSREIKGTTFVVDGLRSNSAYTLRAAAYTVAGKGPSSREFRSKTLRTNQKRLMIWASNEGIMQSDIVGESVTNLVKKSDICDGPITDVTWIDNYLYFVCNYTLLVYNRSSGNVKRMNMDSIGSIAIDWLGKKIYYSNQIQQSITRANLLGEQQEALSILASAKEMKIDSLRGFIYYSTGQTVEACRLNGKDNRQFYDAGKYTGIHVIGLTIDYDNKLVFWIVRSYKDSTLLSGKLLELDEPQDQSAKNRTESSVQLPDKNLTGPLAYYSDRLLWIMDDRTLTIANESGQNLAYIRNDKISGIRSVTVIDQSKNTHQQGLIVLPDAVKNETLRVIGKWNHFNISWDPVTNVNYGCVRYEIEIYVENVKKVQTEVTQNYFEFAKDVPEPYSTMEITIRAFTHWAYSSASHSSIHSPPALPSEPFNSRIFVTHKVNPFNKGLNIVATLRWRQPQKPNGEILGYKIICTWDESGKPMRREDFTTNLQYTTQILLPETNYSFEIGAQTIQGYGNFTPALNINTRQELPIPQVLATTEDGILLVDLDLESSALLTHLEAPVTCITYMQLSDKIYWFDANNELFSFHNRTKTKITAVTSKVLAITIDWVEQVLYWSQTETNGTAIYALNLDRFAQEKSSPRKLLYRNANITDLKVSPMDRIIYWNEVNGDFSIISYYHIDRQTAETFNVFEHTCFNKTLKMKKSRFTDFWQFSSLDTSVGEPRILLGADLATGGSLFYSIGLLSRTCHQFDFSYKTSMSSLVKDSNKFYWFEGDKINAKTILGQNHYTYHMENVHHLIAFHQQNYPKIDCLIPLQRQPPSHEVKLLSQYTESLHLILPEPQMDSRCNITAVGVRYKVMYKPYRHGDPMTCELDNCTKIYSFDDSVVINNLKPFTKYMFQVGLNNFYGEKIGIETQLGPPIIITTAPGEPTEPRNLTAEAVSMTEAVLSWYPPIEFNSDVIWYEVHWQTENALLKNKQQQLVPGTIKNHQNQKLYQKLNSLHANHTYSVYVRAYSSNKTFSESNVVNIQTFPEPKNITLRNKTPYTLEITWTEPLHVTRYLIEYESINTKNSTRVTVFDTLTDETPETASPDKSLLVAHLTPKTQYHFIMSLHYEKRQDPYLWPTDHRFVFETLGDRPSTPGRPLIKHVSGDAYQVEWNSSRDNGAFIEEYVLEGVQRRREKQIAPKNETTNTEESVEEPQLSGNWEIYYNGTNTYWITPNMKSIGLFDFRVRARNSYGWSDYSLESDSVDFGKSEPDKKVMYALYITLPIFVCLFIILVILVLCAYNKKLPKEQTFKDIRIPGVELSNLRELPHIEIAALPQIKRDQITMTDFLGSGAFGEVYEGVVKSLVEKEQRVAIKTLRKGASEQEKMEFLQEAQLMSNFKHEHILKLIGVCFDFDSLYIIMELMQGGDLLSYLRQSRPVMGQASSLTLIDIISMCVDVASGCRYLEEMHFVHRDLAARNCLVSSVDPEKRLVKIGDFGLARDIYKNDYYRKEGEGLLPVRWMSPESLVDGVFTSQSDIWAFGVICWEIMTLGQQPYPARNNVEVLHYVRDGGRLTRPKDCPEELHQLMLKCWNYCPENRPTFRHCLDVLKDLKEKTSGNIQIVAQFPEKVITDQAFIFETPPMSTESFVNSFDSSTTTATPMASPLPDKPPQIHIPKYLELIYDENDVPPTLPVNAVDVTKHQTPYEIPIILNPKGNVESHVIPIVENSNCSSLSGDESSLQALLVQAPPPPPPPTSSSSTLPHDTI
ncbi:proto-oncogene tyrosine-protein kinase ROS isoform X2 [Culicoides brevitarsis]|uniref:proto-oncogene tyrosine-protein kinase ROS isoform X2 n=1 Tax=Culicoides brevitarsis TaxID=469753 RepID=UPI00307B15A8